jgi:serine phosphatase RsbU (regulator of sigma subunit)
MANEHPGTSSIADRLGRAWKAFSWRKHWPWVLFLLGLAAKVVGVRGCFTFFLWVGALVLLVRGLKLLWQRLLFRVSRRLWAILVLLAAVPAAWLIVLALSVGWLAIGGQASRSFQATVQSLEDALEEARRHPSDRDALLRLRGLGPVKVAHVPALPEGVRSDYLGLVALKEGGQYQLSLKAISEEPGGFRILSLGLEALPEKLRAVVGGRLKLRLDPVDTKPGSMEMREDGDEVGLHTPTFESKVPLREWTLGEPLKGRSLLHPFNLPPMALGAWDWTERRYLTLTAVAETNLAVIFKGHFLGKEKGNVSGEAVMFMWLAGGIVFVLACIEFGAFLLGMRLASSLGGHVDALDKGVRRLRAGDLSTRIRVRAKDQLGRLAHHFNEMAEQLQNSMAEREIRMQLEEELRVAREVQMRLLPDLDSLKLPAHLSAAILPANEVAGDWYDFHRLPDGRVTFLIADVSGKGTSAAFYAAETKGMLSALDKVKRGPREVAIRINEIWCASHGRRTFITLCYGVFNPQTGEFAFVRCGHPPALLRAKDGSVTRFQPKGLGIGLTDKKFEAHLELASGRLEHGDALVFFTDGLSEAHNAAGELFGESRIEACLRETTGDPQAALLAEVQRFVGEEALADDLTLLVLKG